MAEKMFDEIKQEAYSNYDIKNKELIKCMMDKTNWTFDIEKSLFVIELDYHLIGGISGDQLKKLFKDQLKKEVHNIENHYTGNIIVYVNE